jgi:enoyl-CoA hydratase/carnithine racemase
MTRRQPVYQAETQDLVIDRQQGVARLTLSRPDDQNRLTPDVLAKLELIAADLARDDEVHVVVISGQGRDDFSMGILPPWLRESLAKDDVIEIVRLANRAFNAVDALPQIVIGALNGNARGGAAELALACDIRIAAEHATVCFPEATWGGFPGAGGPTRLATAVGRARALELICTSREVGAREMERIGLVQDVHPVDEFDNAVNAFAERIAVAGPLAVRGAKRIIRTRLEPGLGAAHELADSLRYSLEWSHDVAEGLAADREKRPPKFVGR